MADWLDEAIEAGVAAALAEYHVRLAAVTTTTGPVNTTAYAKAAVRAAAPIIERAVREAIVARIEAAFITGAVAPQWAQAGGKPTAAGIRRWVIGIVRGEVGDG